MYKFKIRFLNSVLHLPPIARPCTTPVPELAHFVQRKWFTQHSLIELYQVILYISITLLLLVLVSVYLSIQFHSTMSVPSPSGDTIFPCFNVCKLLSCFFTKVLK